MYPLNMQCKIGFAVANSEGEHVALTHAGYGPAFVAPELQKPVEPDAAPKRKPGRPKKAE